MKKDHLIKINERTHIEKHDGGTAYTEDDGKTWTMLPEGSTGVHEYVGIFCKYSERVERHVFQYSWMRI